MNLKCVPDSASLDSLASFPPTDNNAPLRMKPFPVDLGKMSSRPLYSNISREKGRLSVQNITRELGRGVLANNRGLSWIFKPPNLNLGDNQCTFYCGNYIYMLYKILVYRLKILFSVNLVLQLQLRQVASIILGYHFSDRLP